MMKKVVAAAAVLALGVTGAFAFGEKGDKAAMMEKKAMMAEASDARLAAVLVYADWCGSCKILDPKVKEAKEGGAFDGVDYVVLDYTDRDADAFYAAADEAGVGEAVRAHLASEIKTGWMLLVDKDDKRVIGKVTKTLTAEEISGAVKATQLGA